VTSGSPEIAEVTSDAAGPRVDGEHTSDAILSSQPARAIHASVPGRDVCQAANTSGPREGVAIPTLALA
jgi:hypothetical protein